MSGLKVSIVIPTKAGIYLRYLLRSLSNQCVKPSEVILVIKDSNYRVIEKLCMDYNLNSILIEQKEGNVTHALNIGKNIASNDIVVFTDDDAILPDNWIKNYVEFYRNNPKISCVSSRDIYLNLETMSTALPPDHKIMVRIYRCLIRSWLEKAHPLLKKYRNGVYVTNKFEIAHGFGIPYQRCRSLPFRGVNMSFKHRCGQEACFPEDPRLKRALGWEQYFGIQLALKGYDMVYIPNNPVYHIVRESLSRTSDRRTLQYELQYELSIMKNLIKKLMINNQKI